MADPWLDDIIACLEAGFHGWEEAHRRPDGSREFVGMDGPLHGLVQSTVQRLHDYASAPRGPEDGLRETWESMYAEHVRLRAAIHTVATVCSEPGPDGSPHDAHPHYAHFSCDWFADQLSAALRSTPAAPPDVDAIRDTRCRDCGRLISAFVTHASDCSTPAAPQPDTALTVDDLTRVLYDWMPDGATVSADYDGNARHMTGSGLARYLFLRALGEGVEP